MDKDLMENVRKLAKVQAFLREDTNTIATLIQLTEDLAESLTITEAELEQQKERERKLVEALKFYTKLENYMADLIEGEKPYFDFRRTPVHNDSGKKAKATLKELGIL